MVVKKAEMQSFYHVFLFLRKIYKRTSHLLRNMN
jgi:hypothetical protein